MSIADTRFYENQKQAEGNQILLTEEFLRYEQVKALGSISKIYFGESIPDVLVEAPISHETLKNIVVPE